MTLAAGTVLSHYTLLACTPIVLLAACGAQRAASGARSVHAHEGYELVWSDEFDAEGPPSPANWVHELGFVRNEEAQWYQPANARCEGGLLVIEARRERVENPQHDAASKDWRRSRAHAEYSSASIKTRGLHEWTFGRFEMRGRIDTRSGLWPAFWSVGTARGWPANGEFDVMESFRGLLLANAAWSTSTPGKAKWDDARTPIETLAREGGFADAAAWSNAFHVWRMDWDAASMRFYVDGRLLNEVDLTRTLNATPDGANPFHEPHHLILNLAIGGTSGGDPSKTEFPARFETDWVRLYQRAAR